MAVTTKKSGSQYGHSLQLFHSFAVWVNRGIPLINFGGIAPPRHPTNFGLGFGIPIKMVRLNLDNFTESAEILFPCKNLNSKGEPTLVRGSRVNVALAVDSLPSTFPSPAPRAWHKAKFTYNLFLPNIDFFTSKLWLEKKKRMFCLLKPHQNIKPRIFWLLSDLIID